MIWLGFLISLLGVLLLIALTILLYFGIDHFSKRRGFKNLNVVFIVGIFIITLILHFICIINVQDDVESLEFLDIFALGLKEIYGSLGGITFEGQSDAVKTTTWTILYFASIIWLAGTNALLIGIGISYEFRCKLVFFFNKLY